MESLLCILLLVLLFLFYFSNRQNTINRWCALAGFVFWLGLAKEAISYNLIPFLEKILGLDGLAVSFMLPYSIMTWAAYTQAIPTCILFALALGSKLPKPALRWLFYLPAAVLSCIYYPWMFPVYQHGNTTFWLTFSCYSLLGSIVFTILMIRAVTQETDAAARKQKKFVASITLPPILFCAFSLFIPHLLDIADLKKLWQGNALILLACIVFFVLIAFRGGMMGLRLTGESYRWNSDMGLIRKGASYTGHMIKNQTAKMAWCVENLVAQYAVHNSTPPEELMILTRAIGTLQAYSEKNARYANAIVLDEGAYPLDEMLGDAFSLCTQAPESEASLCLTGLNNLACYCDRTHMTEVFVNLFNNALEAMTASALIEVSASSTWDKGMFTLCITDHGRGMSSEDAQHIFAPYFTTKVSPQNLGLGLSYCKNVIQKHGGTLNARSKEGKGTTMIICLPAKRILSLPTEKGKEAAQHA